MKIVIQNMTVWNWLALIAFFFATISVLNAFLSLKSRFRDWRGIQSKKAFEKRVRQLERELTRIRRFALEPERFHFYLLDRATRIVGVCLAAMAIFMIAFGISVSPLRGSGYELVLVMAPVLLLVMTISVLVEMNRLIRVVGKPSDFAIKLIRFMVEAKDKGFELRDDGELMKFLKQVKTDALAKQATD
jgi:hypothetical protein